MARITLSTHWKFQRLARTVGSKVLARGILETIWEPCWVAGDAYIGTSEDIEALCEWKGEPGALTKALLMAGAKSAGFIEPYEGQVRTGEPHYQVHDFLHHCPEYVRRRRDRELDLTVPKLCIVCGDEYFSRMATSQVCGDRCRLRLFRSRQRDKTDAVARPCHETADETFHETDETDGNGTHTHSTQYVPSTPTLLGTTAAPRPRATAPRHPAIDPDMEGDDNVPTPDPPTPPAPLRATKTPARLPDISPVILTFPVTGQGGPTWALHEVQLARWKELYPTIDVLTEARHALAWLEANPSKRKTAGGMPKFCVSWFNRSVDAPRGRSPALITGSLKTAGNVAAIQEVLRRRGHAVD